MAKIDPFVQVEDGEPSPKSTRKEANLRFCQLLRELYARSILLDRAPEGLSETLAARRHSFFWPSV